MKWHKNQMDDGHIQRQYTNDSKAPPPPVRQAGVNVIFNDQSVENMLKHNFLHIYSMLQRSLENMLISLHRQVSRVAT